MDFDELFGQYTTNQILFELIEWNTKEQQRNFMCAKEYKEENKVLEETMEKIREVWQG